MNRTLFAILGLVVLSGCSVQRYNTRIETPIAAEKLHKDVDFTIRKLKKYQPSLDWYISKDDLQTKFDSIKSTITEPMKPNELQKALLPAINAIGQGHLRISPLSRRYTKKETEELKKKGIGPISQFSYEIFDGKLFITANKSKDKSINVGSQVISINGEDAEIMVKNYVSSVSSDGYNKTFQPTIVGQRFTTYYGYDHIPVDSARFELKYGDSLSSVWIKRPNLGVVEGKVKSDTTSKKVSVDKSKKSDSVKRKTTPSFIERNSRGYDRKTGQFSRTLTYLPQDSTIAVMRIKDFRSPPFYGVFYDQSFKEMKARGTQSLILDVRGNTGGKIQEIVDLYAYMTDSSYRFVKKGEVTSRTSFPFSGVETISGLRDIITLIYTPVFVLMTWKKGDKYHFPISGTGKRKPSKHKFDGDIYVITNGASFSATSILSSNLQGSGRAFFVGEETGGTYNGTVAGYMPIIKLPNSKLPMRIGIMKIRPYHQTKEEGHGIYPDKRIIPTIDDRINKVDPELNWIIERIKANK